MCRNYSRSWTKTSKSIRDPYNRNLKGSPPIGVTRTEIGNLLENFKTNILGTLGSQLDTFKAKKRQEEENAVFSIFCPKCRRKHPARECPLNNISVCRICPDEHETDNCPLLPGLQAVYKSGESGETSYPSRRPWQPRGQPSYQEPYYNTYQYPQPWNASNWQNWPPQHPPQYVQHQRWPQGWKGQAPT